MSSLLFVHHPNHEQHSVPPTHPESPLRGLAIETKLRESGLWKDLTVKDALKADSEYFKLVHTKGYIDQLYQMTPKKGIIYADEDTALSFDTLQAVEEATGSGLQAVDAISSGEFKRAFCAVRPPGHHAEPNKTMGFCFINNIAVAAQYALTAKSFNRVLIFDFDVHQGNGTIEAFQGRDDVMVVSSFQHPYYPYTHWQSKHENIVNIPLRSGTDSLNFRKLVEEPLIKRVNEFKPDLILLSAGFDAHTQDPLAEVNLVEDDFYWVTKLSTSLANDHAQGRILSLLEGGYDLEALAKSAHKHIEALLEK